MARAEEHPDGDDLADALPRPLGALHCHGQGRPGKKGGGGTNIAVFLNCSKIVHGQGRPGKRVEVGSIAALSKETAPLRRVCVPRSASSGNLTRWRFTETSLTPITR